MTALFVNPQPVPFPRRIAIRRESVGCRQQFHCHGDQQWRSFCGGLPYRNANQGALRVPAGETVHMLLDVLKLLCCTALKLQ